MASDAELQNAIDAGFGKWTSAQLRDVTDRRRGPWTLCVDCHAKVTESGTEALLHSKGARILGGLALVAAVVWTGITWLGTSRIEPQDPSRAAERLATCREVWSQADIVYGLDSDDLLIRSPLSPQLVRNLRARQVRVEPKPDHPGWFPVAGILLIATSFVLATRMGLSRTSLLRFMVLTVGVTTLYLTHWAEGARIDTSEGGIYQRAFEGMPIHVRRTFAASPTSEAGQVMSALQSNYVLFERVRNGDALAFWSVNFFLRWGAGLALMALVWRRLGKGGATASTWLSLFFGVVLASTLPFLVAHARIDPGHLYWSLFLVAVCACWRAGLSAPPPSGSVPPERTAAAALLVFFCLAGTGASAQGVATSGDEITWSGTTLRPGDVIAFPWGQNGPRGHVGLYLGKDECGQPTFFDFYPEFKNPLRKGGKDLWGRVVPEKLFADNAAAGGYLEFQVIRLKGAAVDKALLFDEARRTASKYFGGLSLDGWSVCTTTVSRVLSAATGKSVSHVMPGWFEKNTEQFERVTPTAVRIQDVRKEAELRQQSWEKSATETCKSTAQVPPKSPGGIALGTRLDRPAVLDRVRRLSIEGDGLRLESADAAWRIDDLDLDDFALILRCLLLNGEAPALSIGSEPSGEMGSARVTYFGGIRHTNVGSLMLAADLKLKAILLGMAAGPRGRRLPRSDDLFRRFPGAGGDSVRLWIVGSTVRLRVEGSRIILDDPGLRLMDETLLRGAPFADPQMRSFTDQVSTSLRTLGDELPEFKALENLVFMSALAFWIRSAGIEVDPALLALPPLPAETPSHVPVAAARTPEGLLFVSGGVALTPEVPFGGSGRRLIYRVQRWMSNMTAATRSMAFCALALGLLLFLAGPPLWFSRALQTSAAPVVPGFRRVLFLWLMSIGVLAAGLALTSPSILEERGASFDGEWLRLMILVLVPAGMLAAAPRFFGRETWSHVAKGPLQAKALLLGAACPAAALGSALIIALLLAMASTGSGAAPAVTVAMAPAEGTLGLFFGEDPSEEWIRFGPQSLGRAQRHPFRLHRAVPTGDDLLEADPRNLDMMHPWLRLRRIRWDDPGAQREGYTHYSVSGEAPF